MTYKREVLDNAQRALDSRDEHMMMESLKEIALFIPAAESEYRKFQSMPSYDRKVALRIFFKEFLATAE